LIAVGLTAVLFFFWLLVGLAVLGALHTQRTMLRNVLLAPAVGLGVTTLLIVWLNRAGLPVISFAIHCITVVLVA
jgi:hypothetical protein